MARKAGWGSLPSLPPRFSLNPSYLFVQNVGNTRLSRVFVFVTWNLAAASFVCGPDAQEAQLACELSRYGAFL